MKSARKRVRRTGVALVLLLSTAAASAGLAAPTHVGVKTDDLVHLQLFSNQFRRVEASGLLGSTPFVVPPRMALVVTDVVAGVFAGPASGFVAVRPQRSCPASGSPAVFTIVDVLVQLGTAGYGGGRASLTSGAVVGPGCSFTNSVFSAQGGSPVVTVDVYGYLTRAPR